MSRTITVLAGAGAGLALLLGCTNVAPHPGRETYTQYCAMCHGPSGLGDGPVADKLPLPPADLSVLTLTNGGIFPTEHVLVTVHGYPGTHDTSVMPEFAPLLAGPEQIWVTPQGEEIMTPVALLDLADYLETLQR